MRRLGWLSLSIVLLAGCGGDSPTQPTRAALALQVMRGDDLAVGLRVTESGGVGARITSVRIDTPARAASFSETQLQQSSCGAVVPANGSWSCQFIGQQAFGGRPAPSAQARVELIDDGGNNHWLNGSY